MEQRRIVLRRRTREKLEGAARRCHDADTRTRYRIVLRADQGHNGARIARELGCCEATVSRTLDRYEAFGEAGLLDGRADNGNRKADEFYVQTVLWILEHTPREHGHRRPTWTQPLLIETARRYTGVSVSLTTMGRLLAANHVRRGRPKPDAPCPWSKARRTKRMALIHALIASLPPGEACVWEDEADVELNPRIGCDWMLPGCQRHVMTPGKNVRRYVAGAMDAGTDHLVWAVDEHKGSLLFIGLLKRLLAEYAQKEVIHVICDNYVIHASKQTRTWLAEHGEKFRLHFLPPYCPDDNRIERKVWREMHANVTVNHRCRTIQELVRDVAAYLMKHNRRVSKLGLSESREAI